MQSVLIASYSCPEHILVFQGFVGSSIIHWDNLSIVCICSKPICTGSLFLALAFVPIEILTIERFCFLLLRNLVKLTTNKVIDWYN